MSLTSVHPEERIPELQLRDPDALYCDLDFKMLTGICDLEMLTGNLPVLTGIVVLKMLTGILVHSAL